MKLAAILLLLLLLPLCSVAQEKEDTTGYPYFHNGLFLDSRTLKPTDGYDDVLTEKPYFSMEEYFQDGKRDGILMTFDEPGAYELFLDYNADLTKVSVRGYYKVPLDTSRYNIPDSLMEAFLELRDSVVFEFIGEGTRKTAYYSIYDNEGLEYSYADIEDGDTTFFYDKHRSGGTHDYVTKPGYVRKLWLNENGDTSYYEYRSKEEDTLIIVDKVTERTYRHNKKYEEPPRKFGAIFGSGDWTFRFEPGPNGLFHIQGYPSNNPTNVYIEFSDHVMKDFYLGYELGKRKITLGFQRNKFNQLTKVLHFNPKGASFSY